MTGENMKVIGTMVNSMGRVFFLSLTNNLMRQFYTYMFYFRKIHYFEWNCKIWNLAKWK